MAYKARRGHSSIALSFADAWDNALEEACDRLEEEAWRRAVDGWGEPVFFKGQPVGVIRRYSDRLLEVLLKAHLPQKYRERATLEHSGPAFASIPYKGDPEEFVDSEIIRLAREIAEQNPLPPPQEG